MQSPHPSIPNTKSRRIQNNPENRSETLSEVVPIAAVDDHPRAYLVGLHTVAIELHLVQPAVAGGHFLDTDWAAGRYKAERGHDPTM